MITRETRYLILAIVFALVGTALLASTVSAQVTTNPTVTGAPGAALPTNCTTGQVPVYSTGTGLWSCGTAAAGVVTSITGTANQITVGGTAAVPILSTPQDIATASTPTFASVNIGALGSFRFNGGAGLFENGANKVEQRNGTNPQLFSVCNTYTSSTSYECLAIDWQSTGNTMRMWSTKGSGAGSYRSLVLAGGISSNITLGVNEIMTFGNGSGNAWQIVANRDFLAATTNTFSIGTSTAAGAPKNIFAGTKVEAPTINATTALQLNGVPLLIPAICSNTSASTAVTATATETVFDLTQCKIAANVLAAGSTLNVHFDGIYSGNAADTVILRLKAGQVQGCGSGTVVTLATSPTYTLSAVTAQYWDFQGRANARTIGSSGTVRFSGKNTMATTGLVSTTNTIPASATSTWNTTVDEYFCLSVQFSSTNAANSMQIQNLQVIVQ